MSTPISESRSSQPDVAAVFRHVAEIRDPATNHLLFRVFCDTWEIEIQQRGRKFMVDMRSILTGTPRVCTEAPRINRSYERVKT